MTKKNLFVLGLLLSSQLASATPDTPPTAIETVKTKITAMAGKVANLIRKPGTIALLFAITAVGIIHSIRSHRHKLHDQLLLATKLNNPDKMDSYMQRGARFNSPQEATLLLDNAVKSDCDPRTAQFLVENGAVVSQSCLNEAMESKFGSSLFVALCKKAQIINVGVENSRSIKASDLLKYVNERMAEKTQNPTYRLIRDHIQEKYDPSASTGRRK